MASVRVTRPFGTRVEHSHCFRLDGAAVKALVWVDVDLDRTMDLAVLESRKLTVYHEADGGWSAFLTCELPGDVERMSAADLDDDAVPAHAFCPG